MVAASLITVVAARLEPAPNLPTDWQAPLTVVAARLIPAPDPPVGLPDEAVEPWASAELKPPVPGRPGSSSGDGG